MPWVLAWLVSLVMVLLPSCSSAAPLSTSMDCNAESWHAIAATWDLRDFLLRDEKQSNTPERDGSVKLPDTGY